MRNHISSTSFTSNPHGTHALNYENFASNTFDSLSTIASQCGPIIYAVLLDDNIIKIGYTEHLNNRMSDLGCGLSGLLALMPGTIWDEQFIHRALKSHRAYGREYYHADAPVIKVVNRMRAKMNLKPIAA